MKGLAPAMAKGGHISRRNAGRDNRSATSEEAVLGLQRHAGNHAVDQLIASRGSARPLPPPLRREMEARLGTDLQAVRVHDNGDANEQAAVLGAKAVTVGEDIVFGEGRFAPDTLEGRRLIGHELVHVVQQRRGGTTVPSTDGTGPLEAEAGRVAGALAAGSGPVGISGASAVGPAAEPLGPPTLSQEDWERIGRIHDTPRRWTDEGPALKLWPWFDPSAPSGVAGSPPAGTASPSGGTPTPTSNASGADRARSEDVAPPQLALGDPYKNAYTLATDYALTARLLGRGFDALPRSLREPFPDRGRVGDWLLNPAARALIASPMILAEIAAMTYSHEMGHYRADLAAGGNPVIHFPRDAFWAIWTGLTDRNEDPANPFTRDEELITEGAGANQEQWNADYLFWDAARRGGGLSEAAAYFLARSNTYFYSHLLPKFKGVTNMDDINQYVNDLKVPSVTRDDISLGSGLTAAFSSGTLGAFRSLGRYLATGESKGSFQIPRSRLGPVGFTWPDFHYLLSTKGPVTGGKSLLQIQGLPTPVGVSLDVRPRTGGVSLGGHLYDWRVHDRVRLNPFIGLSRDAQQGKAARVGTDIRVVLPRGFQIIATPSYTFGSYLLDEEQGIGGFEFNASLGLPFR